MKKLKNVIMIFFFCFFIINPDIVQAETGTRLNDERISEEELLKITKEVGEIYNINPYLLFALTETESARFIYCINYNNTCFGLTQISTYWHSDRMKKLGITNIYDPYSNLLCCADYISELYSIYTTTESVLMHYNMITSIADEMVANGQVSDYARNIIDKANELEQLDVQSTSIPEERANDIVYNEAKLFKCFSVYELSSEPIILEKPKNKNIMDFKIYDIIKNKNLFDIIKFLINS